MMDEERSTEGRSTVEEGGLDTPEEAFMKGFNQEEEVDECDECGSAIEKGSGIVKNLEGESRTFCSKICVEEYEEGISDN